jgi:hypothetical protein
LVTDQPDICGWFGCSDNRLAWVRVGPVEIVTSPGETFPETLSGRPASEYDFGAPWGISQFPAMTGVIAAMAAPIPMLMSVCGNEVAYLIPAADWHPFGHPDHYEEDLCFGHDTETIYREAALALLSGE